MSLKVAATTTIKQDPRECCDLIEALAELELGPEKLTRSLIGDIALTPPTKKKIAHCCVHYIHVICDAIYIKMLDMMIKLWIERMVSREFQPPCSPHLNPLTELLGLDIFMQETNQYLLHYQELVEFGLHGCDGQH